MSERPVQLQIVKSPSKRTLAAQNRQKEAEASGTLSAYRAAKYLDISADAFSGWVFRYGIPAVLGDDGKPMYRMSDLDTARKRWLELTNQGWRRGLIDGT